MAQDRKKRSLWPLWLLTLSGEAETSMPNRGVISKLKKGRTLFWGCISLNHYFRLCWAVAFFFFKLHVLYSICILFQTVLVTCGYLNMFLFICGLPCVWLCNCMDLSLPDSSVQAIMLEWVAISSTRGSFWPRVWTCVSCISRIGWWILYHWAT